jgi:hypothetical protein
MRPVSASQSVPKSIVAGEVIAARLSRGAIPSSWAAWTIFGRDEAHRS